MTPFVLVFLISTGARAETDWSTVQANSKAVEKLQKQDFKGAEKELLGQVGRSEAHPELLYNLGLTYDGLGDKDKANSSYNQALKSASKLNRQELKFATLFNKAELAHREGKVEEALQGYLQALQENPNSIEAKTNIELLTQSQQDSQKQNKEQDQKDGSQSQNKDSKNKDSKGKDKPDPKDNKDQRSQDQKGKDKNNQGDKDKQDKDQSKDSENKNDNKDDQKDPAKDKDQNGHHQRPQKPKPQPFKGENLSPTDVKKIMEELDRQEQRVRAEFSRKQQKEKPLEKDW